MDFRAVAEVPRAFRCDFWIIVKNDGRDEHRVALAFLADKHGPIAGDLALGRLSRQLRRRIEKGIELPSLGSQNGVRRNQRVVQKLIAALERLIICRSEISNAQRQTE